MALWRAPAGATPAAGNYIYLQSDQGDFVGQGGNYLHTQADSVLSMSSIGAHLRIGVQGDHSWNGEFQGMSSIAQLQPGYYPRLLRYPVNNPAAGGMDWSGDGRGCNISVDWFVIDSITYSGGALTSVDLRFEQHCDNDSGVLHGQVHWTANDPTTPPGPQTPIPAGLWSPPAGSTPASGSYIYLQSDPGDFIGGGATAVYTPAISSFDVFSSGRLVSAGVSGWLGQFQAMNSIPQLQPGYYPGLHRYPFNNPATGGLDWRGDGRGCNTLNGWFAIDAITFSGSTLASLDLRFEQHCEGATAALHGQVHWVADAASTAH